jgi:NADH:ubiquinone oxidoreductase subunit 6 (subunit J)
MPPDLIAFLLIAGITLGSAAAAMLLRNLIHSALLLVGSWAGIAAFYLWAGAEFVAFAQTLVYVGAVSMIVLFAVLLTRRSRSEVALDPGSFGRGLAATMVGAVVLGVLSGAILVSDFPEHTRAPAPVTVRQLGTQLMTMHTAALLIVGVILTVALLGAVVLAAVDRDEAKEDER